MLFKYLSLSTRTIWPFFTAGRQAGSMQGSGDEFISSSRPQYSTESIIASSYPVKYSTVYLTRVDWLLLEDLLGRRRRRAIVPGRGCCFRRRSRLGLPGRLRCRRGGPDRSGAAAPGRWRPSRRCHQCRWGCAREERPRRRGEDLHGEGRARLLGGLGQVGMYVPHHTNCCFAADKTIVNDATRGAVAVPIGWAANLGPWSSEICGMARGV